MTSATYRRAMFRAFSVPVVIFFGLPFAVAIFQAPKTSANLLWALGTASALLIPIYLVGFMLAPWSGRRLAATKAPAFLMAAAGAVSSALAAGALAGFSGSWSFGWVIAGIFGFFAIPASLLGAVLFIGHCQCYVVPPESAPK